MHIKHFSLESQDKAMATLQADNEDLKARLSKLEQLIAQT